MFTEDYYSNPGPIQWNYYLVLLYNPADIVNYENRENELKNKIKDIEKNEEFAKKFVIKYHTLEELDNWLKDKYIIKMSENLEISQDLSTLWMNKLEANNLSFVYSRNTNLADDLSFYIKGNFTKEPLEEALSLYNKALKIFENTSGSSHPHVVSTLREMAKLYQDVGNFNQALLSYQYALTIIENAQGSEHPDVATMLNNLAELYYQMGEYEKALPLYNRALEIFESKLGPAHPNFKITEQNIQALKEKMKEK